VTRASSVHMVPAFARDSSVRRSGSGGRFVLGGSPIRLFSLTPAGAALMDRIELSEPFEASPAERDLINRWQDAGLLHPRPDLTAAVSPSPQVTLVVPVRDRAEGVLQLLASIAADQSAAAAAILEILIVDDGSAQPLVIETAGQRLPAVRVIRIEESIGPGQARNLGLTQVSTELVAFVDSDCQVTPNWLAPLLGHIADPLVVAAAPRVKAVLPVPSQTRVGPTTSGHLSALEQYELSRSPLDLGEQAGRVAAGTRVSYVPSAAVLMRTEVVRQAGGFNPSLLVGEDVDLIWRLVDQGGRVRYEPRSVVHHEIRSGLPDWIRQRVGYGTSAAALDRAHPGLVAPVVLSPWSAAVWGLVATAHPVLAAALGVGTTVQLSKKLPELPRREVMQLGIGGHLGAGRQLARSVQRVWWPVALPVAVCSPRVRHAVLGAAVLTALDSLRQVRSEATAPQGVPESLRFVGLGLLDDMSYGAGVWLGCIRELRVGALLPSFARSRSNPRSRTNPRSRASESSES
jgi:mycofactocin system glycosyltransferase